MDRDFLITAATEALNDLGEARREWVGTAMNLVALERDLAVASAVARRDITLAAGGAKALGSNAELREQALLIALESDKDYQYAQADYDEVFVQEALAKQEMYTLKDTLSLFRVLLETYEDPPIRYIVGG